MTDRERIEYDIDHGLRLALLALADLCEDAGDQWAAAGYRWLAKCEKAPKAVGYGKAWRWKRSVTSRVSPFLKRQTPWRNATLPLGRGEVFDRDWESKSAAFRAAAEAIGVVLKGEAVAAPLLG